MEDYNQIVGSKINNKTIFSLISQNKFIHYTTLEDFFKNLITYMCIYFNGVHIK